MKKFKPLILAIIIFSLGSLPLYAGIQISPALLDKINEERLKNNLDPIHDEGSAESIIQDELDRRVHENLERLEQKKPLLQAMPIAEAYGSKNIEREKLRRNAMKAKREYLEMAKKKKNR